MGKSAGFDGTIMLGFPRGVCARALCDDENDADDDDDDGGGWDDVSMNADNASKRQPDGALTTMHTQCLRYATVTLGSPHA